MQEFRVTLRFRLPASDLAPVLLALVRVIAALRSRGADPHLTIERDRPGDCRMLL